MKDSETKVSWILRLPAKFQRENDDATKQTGHLASFGVVFWKVGFIASLSITVSSSETLLVTCHSRCRILAVECMLIKLVFMMESHHCM